MKQSGVCGQESRPFSHKLSQIQTSNSYEQVFNLIYMFPVAQLVEHGASNAKIMGSIPSESKS